MSFRMASAMRNLISDSSCRFSRLKALGGAALQGCINWHSDEVRGAKAPQELLPRWRGPAADLLIAFR